MAKGSGYERLQIESLLGGGGKAVQSGVGLFLSPQVEAFLDVFEIAVSPALGANGLNTESVHMAFDSGSSLATVCRWVQSAEVIIADLTGGNQDLLYVLGLAHGLGRCPLLLTQLPADLPFNLAALRCIEYLPTKEGLLSLREQLLRAIRVFLAAARAEEKSSPDSSE